MIRQDTFTVEPWNLTGDPPGPGQAGADRIGVRPLERSPGLRANLDEGEPYGLPGTYLNGFYEVRPLPYAEPGYGYPEQGRRSST